MIYYKRHLGDYAKKAGHLSVLEHGVYTLLLDAYYDTEQAPTKAEAIRKARVKSADELAALDAVLADFFTEIDGRFVQSRVEEEFLKAEEQAKTNANNGKKGGRPRKSKGITKAAKAKSKAKPKETESVNFDNRNDTENNPKPLIHQSTNLEASTNVGADAPMDTKPADPIWGTGLAYLMRCGLEEQQARKILGKLKQAAGDITAAGLLAEAEKQSITDPIPWLAAGVRNAAAKKAKPSVSDDFRGKTYAGTADDDLPESLR